MNHYRYYRNESNYDNFNRTHDNYHVTAGQFSQMAQLDVFSNFWPYDLAGFVMHPSKIVLYA
jgi:hypothetical protein